MRDIEQVRPNKPNFLLVVLLSGATLVVLFVIAYFVLHWEGTRLVPKHHSKNPTSQLVLPATPRPALPDSTVA
jgi:tellurite resistance protein TehA-like permease